MIDRAETLREAIEANGDGAGAYPTPYGEVNIRRISFDGDMVEVFLADGTESGEAHYRIVNPPLLVPDPNGERLTADGPHRFDPIAALTYVIGSLGGATKPKGRRSR